MVAGGETLVVALGRHPQVVVDEAGAAARIVVVGQQRVRVAPRHHLEAGRVADGVRAAGALHAPQGGPVEVHVEPGLALGRRDVGLLHPQAAPGMLGRQPAGDQAVGDEPVVRAVHVQVEPEAEVVVVVHGDDVRLDEAAVGVRVAACGQGVGRGRVRRPGGRHGPRGRGRGGRLVSEDAGGADPNLDRAVLAEDPVDQVVVVADDASEPDDEVPALAALPAAGGPVAPRGVAGLALVDADRPRHGAGVAVGAGLRRIDVNGVVGAVVARHQRLAQAAGDVLADVDEVLPVPGVGRVHVGDEDLGQVALVEDRAGRGFGVVPIRHERQDEAGALVRPKMEVPVLPGDPVAVELEAAAERLADLDRPGNFALLAQHVPEVGFDGGNAARAFVDDAKDLLGLEIHDRDQVLDGVLLDAVGLAAAHVGDAPALFLFGTEVAARPSAAVDEREVGDASGFEAGEEVRVFEHLVRQRVVLASVPVGLRPFEPRPGRDLLRGQVDDRLEGVVFPAHQGVGAARHRLAGPPGQDLPLGGLVQGQLRELRVLVDAAGVAQQHQCAPDLVVAQRIERMVRRRNRRRGGGSDGEKHGRQA